MSLAASATERLEVVNPVSGDTVGSVPFADRAAVARSVEHARQAQPSWAAAGFRSRARVVGRFVERLGERQEALLDVLQDETAKTRRDALVEVLTVVRTCQYYLAHGRRFLADRRGSAAVPGLTGAREVFRPHGVVGFVTPWNYPLILGIGDAIPALLAGNAVVIKPSELTPLSAVAAVELLAEAGLPSGVAQLVHGGGEVGADLVDRVDYVAFTGSVATGRKIAVAAGERLIPYSLELGGKNPLVVLEGAPIDRAVDGFVAGAFFNSGQTCIAVERAYVERSVYDEFVGKAIERVGRLLLGFSRDWDLDVGSLISAPHADKVMRHVDEARDLGAEILAGGRRRTDLGPAFVEPTLLAGVPRQAELHGEETFGPVVAFYPVADAEEAIERANDTPYGLNASVWGPGGGRAGAVARRLDTGSASINSALLIYHSFGVPMGGVKQSGIGRRHGAVGIRRFTRSQSIVSSTTLGGGYDNILSGVRSAAGARLLAWLFHLRSKIPGLG